MRRMTKRKIHPDMEEEFQKAGDDGPIKHGPIADKYGGANESVSFLPIAGIIYSSHFHKLVNLHTRIYKYRSLWNLQLYSQLYFV